MRGREMGRGSGRGGCERERMDEGVRLQLEVFVLPHSFQVVQ